MKRHRNLEGTLRGNTSPIYGSPSRAVNHTLNLSRNFNAGVNIV